MADTRVCDDPSLPKKKSTFKITSVTKPTRGGSGELQNDADGDMDSMDDLDESHTEDFSSEILDSSKATDIEQDAVLTPEEIFKPADAQSRFRVVKIETKEPFRRGRWLCHDFLDTQPAPEKSEVKHADEIHVHSGTNSANSSMHYVHGVDDPSRNPLAAGALGTVQHLSDARSASFSPNPGETFKPIHPAPQASQAPAMPVTAIPPQRKTSGVDTMIQNQSQTINAGQQIGTTIQPGNPQMQQPMHIPVASHPNIQQVPQAQTSTAPSIPQTVMATNIQPSMHVHQSKGQSVNVHAQAGNVGAGQGGMQLPQNHIGPGVLPPQSIDPHTPQSQNFPAMTSMSIDQKSQGQVSQNPLAQQHYGQVNQTGTHSINVSASQQNHASNPDNQPDSVHSQVPDSGQGGPQQVTHGQDVNAISRPGSISLTNDHDSNKELMRDVGNDSSGPQALLSPLAAAVSGMSQPADEIKDDRCRTLNASLHGGSSTVAIDNKIEQAMDLVKSHLMFAVREEVEVLKEQIKDLMEKIGQLEYENGVLKANATQETLSKLNLPKPQPPSSSS
ncbi:TSC22 domain family protein 1-like isoform X1 [Haliotis rubra]|uniref:TSC22 domain family protein 1-like isoform X1 n=1 Tax=Haliotis rubra TaxID=36100 RepID=UPI001EE61574|nr:TSC22 domain family protein 1-like isoform X1 [Haliotis rubra]